MKEYGTIDADRTAYDKLVEATKNMDVKYIIHHPRKAINAKPCQLPGMLRVQAVMQNEQVVTAEQYKVGGLVRIFGIKKGK